MKGIYLLLFVAGFFSLFTNGVFAEKKNYFYEYSLMENNTSKNNFVVPIEAPKDVISALDLIKRYIIEDDVPLNYVQQAFELSRKNFNLLKTDPLIISKSFDVVEVYENSSKYGPLFINKETSSGMQKDGPNNIHYYMFALQQAIIDNTYTMENLIKFKDVLDNKKFETSRRFPGAVVPPDDPNITYKVKIDATNKKSWGIGTMNEDVAARRPTGCYAAPGSIVTITVPKTIVNKGFNIRVNAHSWDNSNKPKKQRLNRVSLVYPINNTEMLVANPLGGGIYVEVPYLSEFGKLDVSIKNAVRSPYFSSRSWDKMTLDEWKNIQRKYPAPWADFESDMIMMNMPTSWISNFDNPKSTMDRWDEILLDVMKLRGLNPDKFNKTLLYMQVDLLIRGSAYHPGYPQTNDTYKPDKDYGGNNSGHYFLSAIPSQVCLHELGHAIHITKFRGETEAIVNFLYVHVFNNIFGKTLDQAFANSCTGKMENMTLEECSRTWTVTQEFREGKEMNYKNNTQMSYQYRGYAKYVDIAYLFGWRVLEDFWYQMNVNHENGTQVYNTLSKINNDPVDDRILRLSRSAKSDLRPLIHFWGVHPINNSALSAKMKEEGLKPSRKIYERLKRYMELIPKNNAEFMKHAQTVCPNYERATPNPKGVGAVFYKAWKDVYSENEYEKAKLTIQNILDQYFPDGAPMEY